VTLGGVPVAFLLSDAHSNGWTVGGGVEYMFAPNWSAKAEYHITISATAASSPLPRGAFGTFQNDSVAMRRSFSSDRFASPVIARY
jgi:outer membrane immunogenic protein